jgi:hypothetical protein
MVNVIIVQWGILPTYLYHVLQPSYLPTYRPIYLPTYLPINLFAYLLQPTFVFTYILQPTNLHTYLPTRPPNGCLLTMVTLYGRHNGNFSYIF